MEANPESLTAGMVRDIYALGVNRLSIGVQSFNDRVLALLGRAHTADGADCDHNAEGDNYNPGSHDHYDGRHYYDPHRNDHYDGSYHHDNARYDHNHGRYDHNHGRHVHYNSSYYHDSGSHDHDPGSHHHHDEGDNYDPGCHNHHAPGRHDHHDGSYHHNHGCHDEGDAGLSCAQQLHERHRGRRYESVLPQRKRDVQILGRAQHAVFHHRLLQERRFGCRRA